MHKRILVLLAAIFMIAVTATASFAATGVIQVVVNDSMVDFPDAKPYINNDGRTMVPIRFISEQLDANVDWDKDSQLVNISYQDNKIILPVNKRVATVNSKQIVLDTNAIVKDQRTMVPLRFVSEALGAKVTWDSSTKIIDISTSDSGQIIDQISTADRNNMYQSAPPMVINQEKLYIGTVKTNFGDIKIKLLAAEAPITTNNFVFLSREGFYNDISFHRIIKDFMIQTGDPLGNGTGGPGYKFKDELPPALPYDAGVVAMANSGPNTNGSQFFICNGEYAKQLNNSPNYTVFGQVIEGMDTVLKISDTAVEKNSWGEQSKPVKDVYIKDISIEEN